MTMLNQRTTIREYLSNLKGLPAWGLVRTHGSMFFLELGKIFPRQGELRPHGEWYFLVELCAWRFENEGTIVVGSDDDQEFIDNAFSHINLGTIEFADASPPLYDLSLLFSSGLRLTTLATSAAYAAEDSKLWLLFCPDDNVWVVKAGGHHDFKNRHT